MNIALDLSTARCGVVEFEDDGTILKTFCITPNDKLHPFLKIKYIVDELRSHLITANNCIIEGIFLAVFAKGKSQVVGFETLARLSGAVINEWLQTHSNIPLVLKATEARKLAGANGSSQKAEIQIWVAEKFKLATEEQLDEFKGLVEAQKAQLNEDLFTKDTWKQHMGKISSHIEDITGLTEDVADAYILYLAFIVAKKQGRI